MYWYVPSGGSASTATMLCATYRAIASAAARAGPTSAAAAPLLTLRVCSTYPNTCVAFVRHLLHQCMKLWHVAGVLQLTAAAVVFGAAVLSFGYGQAATYL